MSKTIFQKNLKFTYEDFKNQDVANLMKNIWSYSSVHGKGCKICTTYRNWCIKALKKWHELYVDVDCVVEKLYKQDAKWCNIANLSSNNSLFLYSVISKKL